MSFDASTQQTQHEGLIFYYLRDPIPVANSSGGIVTHTYPWQALGTIEARTDKVTNDAEAIYDDSSGKSRMLTKIQNGYSQEYELTTPNVCVPLREIYLQSLPATAPSPALPGGTVTSAPLTLNPGAPAKIYNANGSSGALAITSITSITVASTPLVFGTDYAYTPQMLAAGFIQILPGSTVVTAAATAATITYVATAVTALVQMIPGSGPCCVNGIGEIHMVSCGQSQYVDQGYFTIDITEAVRDPKKVTRYKPTVSRLWDPTGATPNRVLQYK